MILVQRRIDEMSADVKHKLCNTLRNTEFSLQLDESTLLGNESLLLGYVRFVHNGVLSEELAIPLSLNTDTREETVFQKVKTYFETKAIPLINVISCATDGAPSMMGRYRGFNAFLKSENPNVIICHCVIHRQDLVAKNISGRLNQFLKTAIKAINEIKAHALNTRLFKQLCNENDEPFERLFIPKCDGFQKETALHVLTCFLILSWNFCRVAILVSLKKSCSSEIILHTYQTYSPNLMI